VTLDDLMTLFQSARQGTRDWNGTEWVGVYGGDRAGVTAIVRALRDEVANDPEANMPWWWGDAIHSKFETILGSDAGEKVAEMPDLPTRTVQLTGVTKSRRPDIQFEPATDAAPAFYAGQDPKISLNTDAAPAVCEWRGSKDGQLAYMGCTKRLEWTYDRRKCPSCGNPIKFTEANHG